MKKIKSTVRILSEGYFELASDILSELRGNRVKLRLVSLELDPVTKEAKISPESYLRLWGGVTEDSDTLITVSFSVDKDFGQPGAILLDSYYSNEFYLKSITLSMPESTSHLYFPCHTWINHSNLNLGRPRVLFSNQPYTPKETPPALLKFRQDDLVSIRGDGTGERVHGQRIYDYDTYNDLSNPDEDEKLTRPVLGGSSQYPYPRRCRTGRKHTKKDPASEQPKTSFDSTYVPRDDRFSALKKELFMAAGVRSLGHNVISTLESLILDDRSFDSLEQIHDLYVGGLKYFSNVSDSTPIIRKPTDGTPLEFPPPGVAEANKEAWKSDQEFGRQRLAGINPLVIQRLMVFPPMSALDPEIYGQPMSCITAQHLEPLLEGYSVEEAMKQNLLYIMDYHDSMMPFINRINELDSKAYASRTIFYLTRAGVLLPIVIELTLPPPKKGEKAISTVYTSNTTAYIDWMWRLARTHVAIIDTGYHQLVSHWLRTHACVEPIIIAARRHLSTMHPLHVLLSPHFKDTMHINALARTSLINAGGKIESHFSPGKYCMEISSAVYKAWRFDEEALPKDLLKRGMAIEDPNAKHGLRLTIDDYPYAADGLDVWAAIRQWVQDYVVLYYKDNKALQEDVEVQSWWSEVQNVGHADHAGAEWWASMTKVEDLVEVATTLIWVASAHHAAVNFGQYAYGGYMPNNPCVARRLIPQEGTPEYEEMLANPEKFFLELAPTQGSTTLAMAVLEILSQHMSEEVYLGERTDALWTSDANALAALGTFRRNLADAEAAIEARNAAAATLHHRSGPALLPYTLLAPSSAGAGLTFRGVPNSISI